MAATDNRLSPREKAIAVHMTIVVFSFFFSLAILPSVVPFGPDGGATEFAGIGLLISCGLATVVGLLIPKCSIGSCIAILCIALLVPGCFTVMN